MDEQQRLRTAWQDEIDGEALYRAAAAREAGKPLAEAFEKMAADEARHAVVLAERLAALGAPVGDPRPSGRARVLIRLIRLVGPAAVLPQLQANERAGVAAYSVPEAKGTPEAALAADEQSHLQVLRAMGGKGMAGAAVAQLEGRHRAVSGNALRAAVLGANDGLVSNLSLVMGVAGAAMAGREILVTGLAGLLAGAVSMALGEWLSVQSSRELFARQLEIESAELAASPEEEEAELAAIYRSKGLPEDQARAFAARLIADPSAAIDTLAREELGFDPAELGGSAWEAAATSFALFAVGAVIPVAPFALLAGNTAVVVSLVASALGLFGIGAAITLMTGRSVWASGFRQVLFGLAAAGVTFGVGRLIGVAIAG